MAKVPGSTQCSSSQPGVGNSWNTLTSFLSVLFIFLKNISCCDSVLEAQKCCINMWETASVEKKELGTLLKRTQFNTDWGLGRWQRELGGLLKRLIWAGKRARSSTLWSYNNLGCTRAISNRYRLLTCGEEQSDVPLVSAANEGQFQSEHPDDSALHWGEKPCVHTHISA